MEMRGLRVVVIGGATGGAATALLCARAGAQVIVLERAARIRAVGAGIAMADNGMAVLEGLGLGGALAHIPPLASPAVTDAAGRTLFPSPRGVSMRMMRRSTLQERLLDALESARGVECRLGTTATGVDPAGRVRVESAGVHATLEADLIVAADGAHSTVRTQGPFGAQVRRGIRYLRMLLPEGLATGVEAWTPAGLFGAFPVDGGTYVYASAGAPAVARAIDAGDVAAFKDEWARAYPPAQRVLAPLEGLDALILNDVIRVTCERWHDGAVVLLGDAAHAMAPNLGQGANSALVDAVALVDELKRAPTRDAAFSAYQARRQPAVHRVADVAARLGALAELRHPVARWARDRVLVPLARLVPTDGQVARLLQEPPATLRATAAG